MKKPTFIQKIFYVLFGAVVALSTTLAAVGITQEAEDAPKPIVYEGPAETLPDRLNRKITLDVRDMNIVDVIKFLALKGEFNIIINPTVEGRTTVLLNSISIKDALDISVISNGLAYHVENNIIHVMSEGEYEAMYGRTFRDKSKVEVVRLQYSKPSYAMAALDNLKSNIGRIIIDEDTGSIVLVDTPEALKKMRGVLEQIEQPVETVVYTLQYAQADIVAEKLKSRVDANAIGNIIPDERSNQLIVKVLPGRKQELEAMIASLDVPTKEVLIEARVLQIVLKPNYDLGIDWNLDFKNTTDSTLRHLQFNNILLTDSDVDKSSNYGRIAVGDFSIDNFQAEIKALRQVSDTKILANPRLLVTNGEEAKIHIGDTVPYIISTTSGTGDNAITSEDVRFTDVGLKLNVKPIINDDGYITIQLLPEISSVVGEVDSQGGGIPQVNKTLVETTVMVKDGTTIVIGGLKKDDKKHIKTGVPLLMDIPVLGKAFSRVEDDITSTEIAIFITPHIITGSENHDQLHGTIKPSKPYGNSE